MSDREAQARQKARDAYYETQNHWDSVDDYVEHMWRQYLLNPKAMEAARKAFFNDPTTVEVDLERAIVAYLDVLQETEQSPA